MKKLIKSNNFYQKSNSKKSSVNVIPAEPAKD